MRLRADALFFIMIASVMLSDDGNAVYALLSAAIHESAHLAVMRGFSVRPTEIRAGCSGLLITADDTRCSFYERLLISCSGAAANLLTAAALFFIRPMCAASLALGFLSLLPVRPLDGGETVNIILSKYLSEKTCERLMFALSAAVLLPLTGVGAFILLRTKYNYSLLSLCLCIFASLYDRLLFGTKA